MKLAAVIVAGLIVLSACGDEATPTPVPPTPTPTVLPSPSPSPEPTPRPLPTPTPIFVAPRVILPTPAPVTPTATPTSLEQLSRRLDAIALTTATLRQLSFEAPVERKFIDQEEARIHLVEDFEEDRTEIEARGALLVTLGVLEKGVDLSELLLDVYGEIILGFYEPEDEKIFVVPAGPGLRPTGRAYDGPRDGSRLAAAVLRYSLNR